MSDEFFFKKLFVFLKFVFTLFCRGLYVIEFDIWFTVKSSLCERRLFVCFLCQPAVLWLDVKNSI